MHSARKKQLATYYRQINNSNGIITVGRLTRPNDSMGSLATHRPKLKDVNFIGARTLQIMSTLGQVKSLSCRSYVIEDPLLDVILRIMRVRRGLIVSIRKPHTQGSS